MLHILPLLKSLVVGVFCIDEDKEALLAQLLMERNGAAV